MNKKQIVVMGVGIVFFVVFIIFPIAMIFIAIATFITVYLLRTQKKLSSNRNFDWKKSTFRLAQTLSVIFLFLGATLTLSVSIVPVLLTWFLYYIGWYIIERFISPSHNHPHSQKND